MATKRSPQGTTEKAPRSTTKSTTTVVKAAGKSSAATASGKSRWQRLGDEPEVHGDGAGAGAADPKATPPKAKAATPPATLDDDSGDLVVFAFRMTRAEREEIHDAAGPAKASRFVRSIVLAAARGDLATIQTAVKETRKAVAS